MKYEVFKDDEGNVILQLGLNNNVCFAPECTLEEVVLGVGALVEKVVGISNFELVQAAGVALGILVEDEEQ